MIISAAVIAVTGCGGSTAALPESSRMAETVLWEGEKRGSIFTGPDNVFTEPDSILMETDSSKTEEKTDSVMGSVPYFRDDAGKSTQIAGDYLYGYWNNRLCRYDLETLEETVLYEAASSQHGDFCIWRFWQSLDWGCYDSDDTFIFNPDVQKRISTQILYKEQFDDLYVRG